MAYPQVASAPVKVSSYAKVAAMPAPNHTFSNNGSRKDIVRPVLPTTEKVAGALNNHSVLGIEKTRFEQDISPPAVSEAVAISLQNLSLGDTSLHDQHLEQAGDSGDSYGEDASQVSSSSLNKPQSFDTKSLASVTTFAMDDKESIRPDDSASVRAVDDENPHAALSRNSSFQHDNDQPLHRTSRTFPSNVIIPGRRFPTLANPPRFGNLPISPVLESQDLQMPKAAVQVMSPNDPREPTTIVQANPDEKLMDALASAKDRLPLLQLEERLLVFLRSDSSNALDLPPQNSFSRLLTHKLADYYGLAHDVTNDNASVRIYRSVSRSLPIPLTEVAKSIPLGSAIGPTATAVKIMRREQLNNRQFSAGNSTAPSSSAPSKTTSENGVEGPSDDGLTSPAESTPSRDKSKLSREEREAQYKIARDRIFADFQESIASETISNGENSASLSRSSSSSGRKKSRRHKQPKDDSFEARSAYIPSYTPIQTQYGHPGIEPNISNNCQMSPIAYDHGMFGGSSAQTFPAFDASMQYPNLQGYHPSMMQQFSPTDWQTMQAMQMQNPYFMYPQAMQFSQTANMMMPGPQPLQPQLHDWYSSQSHNYVGHPHITSPPPFPPQQIIDSRASIQNEQYNSGLHRAYSNPAVLGSSQNPKGQKSLFNPQTRSFVPNNVEGRSGNRAGRFKGPTRTNFNPNMQSTGSTNSFAATAKEDSLKQKYGTPPSLPKKPPPREIRQAPDATTSVALPQEPVQLPDTSLAAVNGTVELSS